MAYSSSLTDKEWEILEPLLPEILPQKKRTRPMCWSIRHILDGILYQLKNGCNWRDLPKDLPPDSTVYWHYKQWRENGVITKLMQVLHEQVRTQVKKPKWTRLMIIDSQVVKNTCQASVETKGFCSYKATNGIKRHLTVDTLGFPFFTHCTPGNVSDDEGLLEMFKNNIDYFKKKPVNISKITILLDSGYHVKTLSKKLKDIYPAIMTKIRCMSYALRFQHAPKPSRQQKTMHGQSGFVPQPTRWIIERSNAWMERSKSLVKNFDRTLHHAAVRINLCFTRLMLKRIAASS